MRTKLAKAKVGRKVRRSSLLALIVAVLCTGLFTITAQASNPFLPGWEYIPDAEPYVFEDPDNPGEYRVYIYGSHDSNVTSYCGTEQVVWSAPVDDLTNWRYDGVIFEYFDPVTGDPDTLYAPDVAVKYEDGKAVYYLYPNCQGSAEDGSDRLNFVAKSDRPDGPFELINLVDEEAGIAEGVLGFDPAVFVDDDGRVYAYWGFQGTITGQESGSHAAELDPDTMATVLEGTEIVYPFISTKADELGEEGWDFFEASSIRKIYNADKTDAMYVFIWSPSPGTTNLRYAYSDSPLGGFTLGGNVVTNGGGNNHGGIVDMTGESTDEGEWYVVYHNRTDGDENETYSRQAMAEAIDLDVDWDTRTVSIAKATMTSQGFQVDGLDPYGKYSAGSAYTVSGLYVSANRDRSIDATILKSAGNGSSAGYRYYNFGDGMSNLEIALDVVPQGNDGTISVRTGSTSGTVIATIDVTADMAQELTTLTAPVTTSLAGEQSLFLTFTSASSSTDVADVYFLQFAKQSVSVSGFNVNTESYTNVDISNLTASSTCEDTVVVVTENSDHAIVTFQTGSGTSTYTFWTGEAGTGDMTTHEAVLADYNNVVPSSCIVGAVLLAGDESAFVSTYAISDDTLTLTSGTTTLESPIKVVDEKSLSDLTALIATAEGYEDAKYTNETFAELCYALWDAQEMDTTDSAEEISLYYEVLTTAIDVLETATVVKADVEITIMTKDSYAITVSNSYSLEEMTFTAVLTGTGDVTKVTAEGATVTAMDDNSVRITFSDEVTGDGTALTIAVADGLETSLALETVSITGKDSDGATQDGRVYFAASAVAFEANADINGDGIADVLDLTDLSQYLGVTNQDAAWSAAGSADYNGDGIIDLSDATAIFATIV